MVARKINAAGTGIKVLKGRESEGEKVTKKVEDLQLGNIWAAEKITTKRDQSRTLNVPMALGA